MSNGTIPLYKGEPILDHTPRKACRISPGEIIFSIKQQFTQKELALRELGQNSQDAEATNIRVDYKYEDGIMTIEFKDNGCGMDKEVIMKNYLRLFDSSKEGKTNKVGKWSLGRVSLLCYEPESIEVFTLSVNKPGYRVLIEKDLSGKLYKIRRKDMEEIIGSPHGTIIRVRVKLNSAEEFVKEVENANKCIEKELAWIQPLLTVTTVKLDNGELKYNSRIINRVMFVPGRFKAKLTVKLASGLGDVQCAIGLQSKETSDLASITLCSGQIPIERPSGLPWTHGEDFFFKGMHLILDSFAFQTNIGRNVIYRHTNMMKELLPKLFESVIIKRFVTAMAKLYAQPTFGFREYEESLRLLMADVCIKSAAHGFAIPSEVLEAPFIQSYVSFCPYTLRQLDEAEGPIYFTYERSSALSIRDLEGRTDGFICVCLSDLAWEFKQFLENRYAGRLKEKESSILVAEEGDPEIAAIRRKILDCLGKRTFNLRDFFSGPTRYGGGSYPLGFELSIGRFLKFDGSRETFVPTFYSKNQNTIYLNYNNPHICNLITLMIGEDDEYADVAAHFLMREILFDAGIKLSIGQREQLLTGDVKKRFTLHPGTTDMDDTTADDQLDFIKRLLGEDALEL